MNDPRSTIVLAYRGTGRPIDAIREYTTRLAATIAEVAPHRDVKTAFGGGDHWRIASVRTGAHHEERRFHHVPDDGAWLMLQYNPFSYGRWGIAPWLPLRLAQLRAQSDVRVALMCHEVYVPLDSAKETLMGTIQRMQICALAGVSDLIFASSSAGARQVRRFAPRRSVTLVPVGSNLPDARSKRDAVRHSLGIGPDQIVVTTFGTDHPSRITTLLVDAINAVARSSRIFVLNLGAGAPDIDVAPGIEVHTPGPLEDGELAALMSAGDLCLLPFVDGSSTRRTTLSAALQHQLCVVATDSYNTDPVLREASEGLRLTAPDKSAFSAAALELALDPIARAKQAMLGRALYDKVFAWERGSANILDTLGAWERH